MFVRTQENYREVFKSIVGPTPDLRIFGLTLFNILVGTYLERETCSHQKNYADLDSTHRELHFCRRTSLNSQNSIRKKFEQVG